MGWPARMVFLLMEPECSSCIPGIPIPSLGKVLGIINVPGAKEKPQPSKKWEGRYPGVFGEASPGFCLSVPGWRRNLRRFPGICWEGDWDVVLREGKSHGLCWATALD